MSNLNSTGISISWGSVRSFLRQLTAVVGVVVGVANTGHWPIAMQTAITSLSGILLTVEHYANATNPTTPPNSVSVPPTSQGS